MKVQQVSGQNFNGRLCFMDYTGITGKVEKLSETIAPIISKNYPEIEETISKKPYDLFISRPKNLSEFFQVDANVKFENALGEDNTIKGKPSMVYEKRLDRFPSAAAEAMYNFEHAPAYEKLTKPEGFFQVLWRFIRGVK